VSAFVVHQISVVAHVYWIPTAAARPVSRVGRCTWCGTAAIVEPDMFAALAPDFDGDLPALVTLTNPGVPADYERHCQELAAARRGAIPPKERMRLISEPLQLLAPLVDELYARRLKREGIRWAEALMVLSPIHVIETGPATGSLCPAATVALLVTIATPIALIFIGIAMAGDGPAPWWSFAFAALSVPSGILLIAMLQTRNRRRVLAECVFPLLARSLHPLQPDIAELHQALRACADAGLHIGAAVEAGALYRAIEVYSEHDGARGNGADTGT
jgi:hypothetical protein